MRDILILNEIWAQDYIYSISCYYDDERNYLLHFGLHFLLQGQYVIPVTFLHRDKRKSEILSTDRNKYLIQL
jgi:hypothetical protein